MDPAFPSFGFESRLFHLKALAQLEERLPDTQEVTSSSPVRLSINGNDSSIGKRQIANLQMQVRVLLIPD